MCACNNQSSTQIQPVKLGALKPLGASLSLGAGEIDQMSVGIATMPTGEQIWYVSNGGQFATNLYGYEILGRVSHTGNEITVRASARKGGAEVSSFNLIIDLNNDSLNRLSSVKSLDVTVIDETVRPRNDLADCLKRHGKDMESAAHYLAVTIPALKH